MLRDAAKMLKLVQEIGAHSPDARLRLLALHTPLEEKAPIIWEDEPLQDVETVIIEWFLGEESAFAFVQCWKEPNPRTIEYSVDQLRRLLAAIDLLSAAMAKPSPDNPTPLLAALTRVSEELRLETVLMSVPRGARRLVVVAHGILHAVPIHALPLGTSKGSIYEHSNQWLIDRFPLGVTYQGSIALLGYSQRKDLATRFAPMLQVIAVSRTRPTPVLPHIEQETKVLRFSFRRCRVLQDDAAVVDGLKQDVDMTEGKGSQYMAAVHNSDAIFLSSHSHSHIAQGCAQAIALGAHQTLEPSEIASWSIPKCRLVAIPNNTQIGGGLLGGGEEEWGFGHQGRYAGAPVAFLIAGASAVLISAWIVETESRVLLLARFLEKVTAKGQDMGQALRETQVWLRDCTELEYYRGYPREMQSFSWMERVASLEREEEATRARGEEPLRPFSDPYYWGGLSLWGDGSATGKSQKSVKKNYDYAAAAAEYLQRAEEEQERKKQARH